MQDSEPTDASHKSSVPSEAAFQKTLMQNALPFTFHDGQVPHICPAPEDPVWSVNIKRGILSSIQNSMPRFDLDYEASHEVLLILILYLLIPFTHLYIFVSF